MGLSAFDDRMWRTRPSITELAFLVCGVLIVLVGWVADFLGLFEIASQPTGHGSSTTFPLRLFMTVFLILAYVVTRTMAVWPIGFVEEVEPLGIVSKLVELATVLVLVSLLQSDRASRRQPVPVAAPSDR